MAAVRRVSDASWGSGNDAAASEYAWKARELSEKRQLALTYLGSVQRRVPIHDAVRRKSLANRAAIAHSAREATGLFAAAAGAAEDDGSGADGSGDVDATLQQIDDMLDELTQSEHIGDTLRHIAATDTPLLDGEYLGSSDTARTMATAALTDAGNEEASLRALLNLRRRTDEYQSYMSIPESERTAYSAWYLRHVRAPEADDA